MLADNKKVVELIPQKYPMVMVDGLISNDVNTTVSKLSISKNNIFCSDGFFNEPGLIENIAQTAALRSGYEAMLNNVQPAIGFIGSVKKMKIYKLPNDDAELQTRVTILTRLMNVLIIKGEIMVNDKLIAEGEMNIFLQENTNDN
jgi:3-hydroxymyristoyl/3-hydroxydecanoyl-(acyl carrier protein) dehydratase